MAQRKNAWRILCFTVMIISVFLYGCQNSGKIDKKDVAAYVNNEPILNSELKREMALRVRQDPYFKVTPYTEKEQLNLIINRKLITQEAMARGLAKSDKFVNTIKAFWEQTLIRDFLDYKRKEFQDFIFVTEEEVAKYYDNLSSKVTFKVIKSDDKAYIDNLYGRLMNKEDVSDAHFETVGPVGYYDIMSPLLSEIFGAPIGEPQKISAPPDYYIVTVEAREKIALEAVENIKDEIEKRIMAAKESRMFENWLKEKKAKSNIKIIKR